MGRRWVMVGVTACAMVVASGAWAVIGVKDTVRSMHRNSRQVFVGKVKSVDAERQVLVVEFEAVKGELADGAVRVQVVEPKDLIKEVAPDAPVVVFVGRE